MLDRDPSPPFVGRPGVLPPADQRAIAPRWFELLALGGIVSLGTVDHVGGAGQPRRGGPVGVLPRQPGRQGP